MAVVEAHVEVMESSAEAMEVSVAQVVVGHLNEICNE